MAISQRIRFEIFKRDNFTCQYCGEKSPKVILEIDHIIPKKENGVDDIYNLITSCFDCNRGKRDKLLKNKIARNDLHKDVIDLQKQTEQIKMFRDLDSQKEERILQDLGEVIEYWNIAGIREQRGSGYHVETSFKKFLKYLPVSKIKEAIDITYSGGRPNYFKYFCGICWNWIKDIDNG